MGKYPELCAMPSASSLVSPERRSASQTDGQDERETAEDGDGLSARLHARCRSAVPELRPAAAVAVYDTRGALPRTLCRCACAHLCADYGRHDEMALAYL